MAKARSPRYPGIDLKRAVELATTLHKQVLHHSSAKETILQHWGYSPKSSNGLVAFGALRRFGLIDQKRGEDAKLSQLALEIILDERPDSPERAEAIRKAALNPSLHKELWRKYDGELPSDADIKLYLQREKHFTPQGAEDFISQFKATIAYANLVASEAESDGDGDSQEQPADDFGKPLKGAPQPQQPGKTMQAEAAVRDLTIPLSGGRMAVLRAPVNLSSADHKFLTDYLTLMRDALIASPKASEDADDGGSSND